jgi:hypothetical protein
MQMREQSGTGPADLPPAREQAGQQRQSFKDWKE